MTFDRNSPKTFTTPLMLKLTTRPTPRAYCATTIRSDMENLRDIHFEQHQNISAPQERLDHLTEIVQRQLRQILG